MNAMPQERSVESFTATFPNVPQEEPSPPRSRLYNLVPYEIGTPWCESLTGYINRLGWTHHVSPRALVAQEIVPRLDPNSQLLAPVATFGTTWAMSLNGIGSMTEPWMEVLSHLTTRSDFYLLTSRPWIGDLSPRWQLRETPAWCPCCFTEWRASGHPLYQPLLWMMRIVTVCPCHKTALIHACPHCQKPQRVFAGRQTQPGECTCCGDFLGMNDTLTDDQEVSKELLNWQEWVWAILQELQAAGLTSGTLTWDPFFRQLEGFLKEHKGYSKFAQALGIDRARLYRWVDREDAYCPTLETILKFCYVCQVTPLQVMNGQLDQLLQTIERGTELRSPLPTRRLQRVDPERCQLALNGALANPDEPPALSQIARQLGYHRAQLTYRFPQECQLVVQRAKAYRQQRKEHSLTQIREQVRQAVFSVHAQGLYPSQRRLRPLLPSAHLRHPEAYATWRATLLELGYEL